MEYGGGDVVEVPAACINLPCPVLTHTPNFDLSVVRGGYNQGKSRMESGIIDTAIVTFKDILDGREVVESIKSTRSCIRCALAEAGDVPYAHGLILGCRNHEVLLWMELRRHDIVRVSGENCYTVA